MSIDRTNYRRLAQERDPRARAEPMAVTPLWEECQVADRDPELAFVQRPPDTRNAAIATCERLLRAGADPFAIDREGVSALARARRWPELANFLLGGQTEADLALTRENPAYIEGHERLMELCGR